MSGYPNKILRTDLGPTYENEVKIGNPKREADASIFNLLAWQLAGLNGPAARGLVVAQRVGTAVTVLNQWFAWDPNQSLVNMSITRTAQGIYTWSLPNAGFGVGVYPDKDGTPVSVTLLACFPHMQSASPIFGNGVVDAGGKSGTIYVFDASTAGTSSDPSLFAMSFI